MCKNIFTNFISTYWRVLSNLCEVDVSNQDPRWTGKNEGRAHTSAHEQKTSAPVDGCRCPVANHYNA